MSVRDRLYSIRKFHPDLPPNYQEAAIKVARSYDQVTQDLMSSVQCYGHGFIVDGEVCPVKDECDVSKPCAEVYRRVNELTKPELKNKVNPRKSQPGKYAGTGKYKEYGYRPEGRPVDDMIAVFMEAMKPYTVLPPEWTKTTFRTIFGDRRRIFISRTASYHAVVINNLDKSGVVAKPGICCRIWTNAAAQPLVDLNLDLVDKLFYDFEIFDPPKSVIKKIAPCVKRSRLKSVDDARKLAEVIRELYQPRVPGRSVEG